MLRVASTPRRHEATPTPPKPRPVIVAPTPRPTPRPPRTPIDECAAREARKAAAAHKRVAVYLLFGTYSRAANLCGCSPEGIESALRLAGVARIEKRTPLAAEVERTMRNFGFGEKAITRALRHAAP